MEVMNIASLSEEAPMEMVDASLPVFFCQRTTSNTLPLSPSPLRTFGPFLSRALSSFGSCGGWDVAGGGCNYQGAAEGCSCGARVSDASF